MTSKYKENQFVKFTDNIVSDAPVFLIMSSVNVSEKLVGVEFKVKAIINKSNNVFYTISRNGVFINNVPEGYLIPA